MNSNLHSNEQILTAVILIVLFLGAVVSFIMWLKTFLDRRMYLKSQMIFSRDEEEYEEYINWKTRLRKLYLQSIPFFGWFFK